MKQLSLFIFLFISCVSYAQRRKVTCNEKDIVTAGFSYTNIDCSIFSFSWKGTDIKKVKNFKWNFGDGTSSAKPSPEHVFINGIFKVQLIVTGKPGCSDTSVQEITVNKPKADFMYKQQPEVPGKVSFLTKNVKLSHSWDFGDGIKVRDEVNPMHTYKASGIYNVELFVQNSAGCIDIIYKPISITIPEKNNTVNNNFPVAEKPEVSSLEKRNNQLVKEIFTDHDSVKITLYDNGVVDGDSVTLIYNNVVIASKQMLTTVPLVYYIKIDRAKSSNELVMYADNLGTIPPNTALMVIYDGDKRYELNVSSSKSTNGVISFKAKR